MREKQIEIKNKDFVATETLATAASEFFGTDIELASEFVEMLIADARSKEAVDLFNRADSIPNSRPAAKIAALNKARIKSHLATMLRTVPHKKMLMQ